MDDTQTQLACTNCQQITTDEGKQVWVCENCGTENTSAINSGLEPVTSPPPTNFSAPPTVDPAPDPITAAAQADIAAASAQAGAPLGDIPPVVTPTPPPVETGVSAPPVDQTAN